MFSPLSRTLLAVASVGSQAKRRIKRSRDWFKRIILSGDGQEIAAMQNVVRMLRTSVNFRNMLRATNAEQLAGPGYRQLRMENLEGRHMLSVNVPSTPDLDTVSDSGLSVTDNITNVSSPAFSGTADANSLVQVGHWIDGNADNTVDDDEVFNTVDVNADGSGNYAVELGPLADGNYQIVAKGYDEFNDPSEGWSAPLGLFIDTTSPSVVDDTGATDEDTAVTLDIVANDSDAIDTSLTVTGVTNGANGTVDNNDNGTVTFTPSSDFNGADTFTYTVSDDAGNSATATVNVTVNPVNDPPVAVDDAATTGEDTPVTTVSVLANDTDVDNTLTLASITAFTQGTNGTVVNNGDGTFTYTPIADFNGMDSFTYTISDGTFTDTATVNVTVNPVNDPPVAVNDIASTSEDTPVTVTVLANDNGGPANEVQTLTVTATTNGTSGTVTTNGTTVTYTPNLNFHGSDTFTYTITDDGGLTDTATVDVTVNPINDPPVAVDDAATTGEDTPVTTVNVLANDTDVDNTLTPASITAFTQGTDGTVVNNGDGTFTYTPIADFSGMDSFTYTISDGIFTDTATVNVTVNPVNDPPVAVDDVATTDEDTPITVTVLANDNGGPANEVQTVTVTATTNGAHGTVTTDGTTVTYTPSLNFHGSDTFTYTITDDGGLTDTATVNVTVNPSVVVTGQSSANDGQTLTFAFTTSAPGAVTPFARTIASSNPLDVVTPLSFDSNTGSGTFKVTFHGPIGNSTSTLTVNVTEAGGALVGSNTRAVNVHNTFRVAGIVVNDSGFDFTFNNALALSNLNLYDGVNPLLPGDTFKLPDVVVHAAIGNFDLKGSVVWNAATNTLSWVKSGSVFGADTYSIKLVSGASAFKDTSGNLLDGNGDFIAGDNYQQSVPISVLGGTPIISMPDFARGPGQSVDLTASNTLDTTLPVRATGVNVQGVDFKLVYDTALLTINPDLVTAALPNWSVATNQSVVGTTATLIVSASANLPSAAFTGTTAFVNILATVPTTAPYGATQVLRLIDCEVNEINAEDDNAVQKVAFPGDANGSGVVPLTSPPNAYTAEDAALIARVIVGALGTTGFDAHPLVDPAIVGDASGNGASSLTAFDTSLIAQESAGINTPEVPDGTAPGTGGTALYDPQLSIPDNIPVFAGQTYELPVNITIEPAVVGIISSTYTVKYQTTDLDFLNASNGSDFPAPGWTMTVSEQVVGTIRVSIFNPFPSGNNGGVPLQLGKLNFLVLPTAHSGTSSLQIDPVDPHESGLIWTKDDGSVLIAHLQGDYNFDNSVDAADYVMWRKSFSAMGSGGGDVSGYTTWRDNFGATYPGTGTGSGLASVSTVDSSPVASSNSSETSPAVARDTVLASFALDSRFSHSPTTRIAQSWLPVTSQLGDRNLLYAVTTEKQKYTAGNDDGLCDGNGVDHSKAVDELLSDLDCELITML